MSKQPPHVSGAGGRRRRFHALAALTAASLAAPLALATVATTGPAAAAPADGLPLAVSGDTLARNIGAPTNPNWTWESDDYDDFRTLFDNYNTGGVSFDIEPPIASPTFNDPNPSATGDESGTLADIDVYISSAVGGGPSADTSHYTTAEEQALLRWVRAGGVLIANTNSRSFDNTRYLGDDPDHGDYIRVADPVAFFEGTHGCTAQNSPDCAGGANESAPRAAQVVPSTELSGNGLTNIRNWHTVTYFEDGTLPNNAVTVATLSYNCDVADATCSDGSTYNNDIGDNRTVVAYMPFGSDQFGKGSVVFTSDVDTFSNHYGALSGGNLQLANNVISWIATHHATPQAAQDPGFTPVTPTRVYDTRLGYCAPVGKVAKGATVDVQVTGTLNCGPASITVPGDATAVALNLTATNQGGGGFVTVFPTGTTRSDTSNLNLPPAVRDIANAVVVGVGSGGKISLYNADPGNATDLIVDIVGYWAPGSGSFLTATDPAVGRVFDTRNNVGTTLGKLAQGETRKVQIAGVRGVPGSGVTGVVMNVTATNGTTGGFLTVHDTATAPDASNVNFGANSNVPNLVFAKLAADGSVNVTNAIGNTDVIFDVAGYFSGSGSSIHAVGPGRIFDTRTPVGQLFAGKIAKDGGIASVGINGAGGILPTDGAGSVLVNITVDQPEAAGFFTAFPDAGAIPDASNVNFAPGQTVANLALARVGADGNLRIGNTSPGNSHMIVDAFAWFD